MRIVKVPQYYRYPDGFSDEYRYALVDQEFNPLMFYKTIDEAAAALNNYDWPAAAR